MNRLSMLLFLSLFFNENFAQAIKPTIAIFPFSCALPEYRNRAAQVHDVVMDELNKKTNVTFIDRSMDTFLIRELNKQMDETSIAAKDLVEQGKVLGAQSMIVGTISNAGVEERKTSSKSFIPGKPDVVVTTYRAYISFSLQLMDVETGKLISQKSFSNKDAKKGILDITKNSGVDNTSEGAMSNAINITRKLILEWANANIHSMIKIVKIDERDEHGFPKTVLVKGIDASLSKGDKLTINEIEMIADEGTMLSHPKKIGELKITKVGSPLSECKVTDGEEVLEGKITSKADLQITPN